MKRLGELINTLGYLFSTKHGIVISYFLLTRGGTPWTVGRNYQNIPSLESYQTPRGDRASRSGCYRGVRGLFKRGMLKIVRQEYSHLQGVNINIYTVDPEFLDFLNFTWNYWSAWDYKRKNKEGAGTVA